MRRILPACCAALVLAAAAPAGAATTASAEGDLMPFGASAEPVAGQTVRVLEHPALTTTTDGNGHWRIDGIPVGTAATFAIDDGDRYPIQTATFTMPADGLDRVTFQSPSYGVVSVLEGVIGVESIPGRCHIASTVTRQGYSLYGGAPDGTHGEPGATVTIDPQPPAGDGPIYFNGYSFDLIWPDRSLAETTADGGVLFANVTPGTYTLRAHKAGAVIDEVVVGCRSGVLTNASPPWGLQVRSGGLGPDDTVPFPTQVTTTTTAAMPTTTGMSSATVAPQAAAVTPTFAG